MARATEREFLNMPNAVPKANRSRGGSDNAQPWAPDLYRVLKEARVGHMAFVPDAGHAKLIELFQADAEVITNVLTTEEEGVAIAAGAWLGGQRSVLAHAVERRRQLHQHAVAGCDRPVSAADAGDDARRVGRVQSVAGADGPGDASRARERSASASCAPKRPRTSVETVDGRRHARLRSRSADRGADRRSACWAKRSGEAP